MKLLQLHLGCGNQHFEGYINIDLVKTNATDLVCDIQKLPYLENSVIRIETYHAIEHMPRCTFTKALKEWYRILAPKGKLIIECPDFDANVRAYLEGNNPELQLLYIFGQQRFSSDFHYFGYNYERLKSILKDANFVDIKRKEPQDYHKETAACLRVECEK